jgi:hypothetical protein
VRTSAVSPEASSGGAALRRMRRFMEAPFTELPGYVVGIR